MKHRDSIIDEIHEVRQRIGRVNDFDADRIAEAIRRHEREAGRQVIKPGLRRKKAAVGRRGGRVAHPRGRATGV